MFNIFKKNQIEYIADTKSDIIFEQDLKVLHSSLDEINESVINTKLVENHIESSLVSTSHNIPNENVSNVAFIKTVNVSNDISMEVIPNLNDNIYYNIDLPVKLSYKINKITELENNDSMLEITIGFNNVALSKDNSNMNLNKSRIVFHTKDILLTKLNDIIDRYSLSKYKSHFGSLEFNSIQKINKFIGEMI